MRLLSRISLPLAVLAGVFAAPAVASAGTGYVYLDNNTAGANTISGFSRAPDGALTALPGSPFAAGGAGLGAGIASQGAIRTADDGKYLLAADAGSNQVSVLRIGADGSLTPVAGSPFSSGGVEPDSIAVNDGLVYVSNTGAGGTDYTGFTLSPEGQLHPIPGSTVTLPDNSGPGDVLLNRDNTKLVGTRVNTSLIDSFTLDGSGRPHAAHGSPFAAQGIGPFGSQFRPTNPDQLFGRVGERRPGCAARAGPTCLVSSRRHLEPCMRFSRTRLSDVLRRRHSASLAPRPVGPWRDDNSTEVDQPHPVRRVGQNPPSIPGAPFVTLGDEASQARKGVERDRVEGDGGVSVPEVPRPAAQEPIEVLHDLFDRVAEPATVRELTDPAAGTRHRLP